MALTKATLTGAVDTIKTGFTLLNDLIDDLAAVTSGLGASCIGIEDSAGNMSAEDVEAALAEIYDDIGAPRTMSDIFDEDPDTTVGLTWGFKGGLIRKDNTITTVAAGTISLTDDATNYIEASGTGDVSRNTTSFTSGRIPLREVVAASGVQTDSTDKRAWFASMPFPTTNGQLIVGSTGADPQIATLTGTANQITITNGAGSVTISIPSGAAISFANTGLKVLDTNASHTLNIKPGSDLSADRILTVTTGDADRTVTLSGNLTVESASLVNQDLTSDASPTFAGLTLGATALTATGAEINTACDGIGVSIPRSKIVQIGVWNMVTTASVAVAHGLTLSKIIGLRIIIIKDDATIRVASLFNAGSTEITELYADVTNVNITRVAGGIFASTAYDDGAMNRGFIIVDYID